MIQQAACARSRSITHYANSMFIDPSTNATYCLPGLDICSSEAGLASKADP